MLVSGENPFSALVVNTFCKLGNSCAITVAGMNFSENGLMRRECMVKNVLLWSKMYTE